MLTQAAGEISDEMRAWNNQRMVGPFVMLSLNHCWALLVHRLTSSACRRFSACRRGRGKILTSPTASGPILTWSGERAAA